MRELLLLRHAKSSWADPHLPDRDRDLAPRGIAAAGRIGRLLAAQSLVPELVLCSTARRARRTFELVAAELADPPPVHHLASLYLAAPPQLLEAVRRQDDAVRRLMLVGHDPGIHRLALLLVGADDAAARRTGLALKFPTGALCRIGLELDHWSEVAAGRGRLLGFYTPRELD